VAKARAVATDRFGDIYIAAETKVYVYDNKGKKLLEIETRPNLRPRCGLRRQPLRPRRRRRQTHSGT